MVANALAKRMCSILLSRRLSQQEGPKGLCAVARWSGLLCNMPVVCPRPLRAQCLPTLCSCTSGMDRTTSSDILSTEAGWQITA